MELSNTAPKQCLYILFVYFLYNCICVFHIVFAVFVYSYLFAGTTAVRLSATQSTNDSEAGSSDPIITTTITKQKQRKLNQQTVTVLS